MSHTRPPAVAGLFYPGDPRSLAGQVDALLSAARTELERVEGLPGGVPKALVLPHAGYVYSGAVAALGYALLAAHAGEVERILLLGPAHRVAVRGLAVDRAEAFLTPLGVVRVDPGAARALPHVVEAPEVHAPEHSLEVHLPFVQRALGDVVVVPLAVGAAGPGDVAAVLEGLWDGPGTVVVVSSDLSHYLPYDRARTTDAATIAAVLDLAGPLDPASACGAAPVNGLLVAARAHGLVPHLLGSCNSGDTAGDRQRVVGYAAIGFWAGGRP